MNTERKRGGRIPKLNPKSHHVMLRFDDDEWMKFLVMYEQTDVKAKAVFAKARIFGEPFKVLREDKTLVEYYTKLSSFHSQYRMIGNNYNQVVKELRCHFSEKKAMALLYKLENCTRELVSLTRDYGDKESKVIQNTVGNVFSGQVVGETAKTLSERFGKVLQQRQSMTINRNDKSTSISTQMDSLIPASKISNLTQGIFVGAVSDNFDERIDQKIFHAEIVVDSVKVSAEMKAYQPIPVIVEFKNEDGSDNLKETIEANYRKVKQEILTLVDSEIQRIKNTPALSHLIPDK